MLRLQQYQWNVEGIIQVRSVNLGKDVKKQTLYVVSVFIIYQSLLNVILLDNSQ